MCIMQRKQQFIVILFPSNLVNDPKKELDTSIWKIELGSRYPLAISMSMLHVSFKIKEVDFNLCNNVFISEFTTWTICEWKFQKIFQLEDHLVFIHRGPHILSFWNHSWNEREMTSWTNWAHWPTICDLVVDGERWCGRPGLS